MYICSCWGSCPVSYARGAACWYTGCLKILEIRKHEKPLKILDNKECTGLTGSVRAMLCTWKGNVCRRNSKMSLFWFTRFNCVLLLLLSLGRGLNWPWSQVGILYVLTSSELLLFGFLLFSLFFLPKFRQPLPQTLKSLIRL